MEDYFIYSFCDEDEKEIAIVREDTPKEIMEKFKQKYDEVKFEE